MIIKNNEVLKQKKKALKNIDDELLWLSARIKEYLNVIDAQETNNWIVRSFERAKVIKQAQLLRYDLIQLEKILYK